jgi:hypothetical protein
MKYLLLTVFLFSTQLFAEDLSSFEKTCTEIGFKPKTPDYGDCVLELRSRELKKVNKAKSQRANKVVPEDDLPLPILEKQRAAKKGSTESFDPDAYLRNKKSTPKQYIPPEPVEVGDGSNNDIICQKYGFRVGEDSYKKCRLDLDVAQRQAEAEMLQFEQQKLQYEEQKRQYEAAIKAEHDRREFQAGVNLLMYGLGLAGGRTRDEAAPALYGLPMYPRQPTFQNYTITTPRGISNCVYNTRMNLMNCN